MSQPTGPQGQPNPQQGQPQGYNQQQWQGGYAPSAYSAPAPGYGQPQFAPHEPSAFGALFSTNFSQRFTAPLAKLVMLLAMITAGIYAGHALFEFLTLLTSGYEPGAMAVITAIILLVFRICFAFVLLGTLRIVLEHFVREEKGESAHK